MPPPYPLSPLLVLLIATAVDITNAFLAPIPRHNAIHRGLKAAASPEEDLELTRQIIMEHVTNYEIDDDDDGDEDTPTEKQQPLMVRAALGQSVEKTPVWLFRQAGRHLPEYREYKETVGRNFLEMLQHPEDVAECTLQPIRRYPLDAAILFSDILVIPQAVGMSVTMPGGVGIQVPNPITTPEDLTNYDLSTDKAMANLSHVLESVSLIKSKMGEEGYGATPLIGFSAAPFTLLFYMVGGSSKKNPTAGVDFLKTYPEEGKKLLKDLTDIVLEYLVAQVERGADLLQVFEAMGMMIEEDDFLEYELGCLEYLGTELRKRVGDDVPVMVFARGAGYANKHLAKLNTYNVITIDGSADRATIRDDLPQITLQGNYDPKELIPEEGGTPDSVRESAIAMLKELKCERLIANLGEGLGGRESPELVQVFVDCVHEESQKMLAERG